VAAYTVTAAWTGAGTANGGALTVKVVTGAAATQNGVTVSSNTVTAPQLATGTGVSTGSWVYGVVGQYNNGTTFTANGSSTFSQNVSDGTNLVCYGTFRSTGTMTGGTSATLGATLPTETAGLLDIALAEILVAAGQTLAEDASSPAVANTTAAETLTTASFTPPPGSLIVVQVTPNGTGGTPETTAVTSPGLTFTPLVTIGASTNASLGIWIAQVPVTALVRPVPVRSPAPRRARVGSGTTAGGVTGQAAAAQQGPSTSSPRLPVSPVIYWGVTRLVTQPISAPALTIITPVPAGTVQRPATRQVPRRAPVRAMIGQAGLCAAGVIGLAAVPVPAGHAPPPAGVHTAPGRGPSRARLGGQGLPGAGNPGPFANRLIITPQPHPAPPRSPAPQRARLGPSGLPAAGVRGPAPVFAAVGPPAWKPQPRRPPGARAVTRGITGVLPVPRVAVAAPPQLTQPRRRRGYRAWWRGNAAPFPPVPGVAVGPPRQFTQPPRRPGARALWRGNAVPPPTVPGVAVRAPKQVTQPRRPPGRRAAWRGNAGPQPPPPPIVFDALPEVPTFPSTTLDQRVELLLGGTWTDITSYVDPKTASIPVTRGHPDESTTTTPSGTQLTLNNRDARFTGTNPTGPYYGNLVRNVPLRVSIPEGASYMRSEVDQASYAQCPDAAGIDITGDMEFQLDCTLDNWNSSQILASKWAVSGQQSWLLLLWNDGTLQFQWSQDGTSINSARTAAAIPLPPLRRMSLRVTLSVATGTVTYYTGPPGLSSPSWTQLGPAIVLGGNSVFNSNAPLQIGYGPSSGTGFPGFYGKIHAAQLLSGIGGTAAASPDFTAQTAGPLNVNPYFGPGQQLTSWNSFPAGASIAWSSSRGYMAHGALTLTGNGSVATPQAYAENDPVTPGASYTAGFWVMSPQGTTAQAGINWWTGGTNTGGVYPAAAAIPAGTWVYLTAAGAAPAGTTTAQMFVQQTGTPASTVQLFVSPAALTAQSFADTQGNIWALNGTAEISSRKYRIHAETSAWPQQWDPTGTDVTVQLTAAGVLRRMTQGGSKPLNSAIRRAYLRLTGSIAPVAYWPCEDGSQSTQLASGLGGPAMQIAGAPSLAADSAFLCSLPIPTLNGSTWTGAVPPYTGGVDNVLRFLMQVPAAGDTNNGIIARMYTTGTIARADLVYGTGGSLVMNVYSAAGALLSSFGPASFGLNGELVRVSLELQASGGNVSCNFATVVVGASTGLDDAPNTQTGASVGQATQVVFNPGGLLTGTAIGQVSVQPVWDTLYDLASPLNAWQGEAAGVRFKRLCDEEAIVFRPRGNLAATVPMGVQTAQALTTLLQECADADRGQSFEPRQQLALGYRTRGSMLGQAAAVTVPYSMLMFPLGETEDDQIVQNDVTVTQNTGGSFSEQVLATGALSTQPPPNGVGRYDVSVPVNVAAAGQLNNMASWILHMGTVNEPRYPGIDMDLATTDAAVIALYYAILDMDLGDRLVITSPPAWLPPGQIDQLIQGITENLGRKTLNMAWAGVPQSPWNVMIWNDPVWGRWTTDGSTLQSAVTGSATSLSVSTTNAASPLWSTSGGDVPFDILIAGERMTVTAISGSSSPQTFTVTRAVNGVVKAQAAGAPITLFYPPIWSM
jgi:hypothetical protein